MQRPYLLSINACEDLYGCGRVLVESLFDVIQHGLTIPPDPEDEDEGGKPPPCYYWRRGLLKEHRAKLTEALRSGQDDEPSYGDEQAWNYVIVFRKATAAECITGRMRLKDEPVVVERFLDSARIGSEVLSLVLRQ